MACQLRDSTLSFRCCRACKSGNARSQKVRWCFLSPIYHCRVRNRVTSRSRFVRLGDVGPRLAQRESILRAQLRTLLNDVGKGAVFGPPAAAAAVSKLLGLSPEEIEDAFGTARTQACGLTATRFESVAQRMQHGFAARNGLFAALMSRGGFTGIDKTLKMPHGGFLSTFGNGSLHDEHYLPAKLTDGLGDDWEGMSGMRVKPYASQISTHAPINCIEVLQEEYPERFASLESIQKIKVTLAEAPFAHGGMSFHLHSRKATNRSTFRSSGETSSKRVGGSNEHPVYSSRSIA